MTETEATLTSNAIRVAEPRSPGLLQIAWKIRTKGLELDEVVPRDQPPTLKHLKRLPYTLQTIKEVLRLYPPSPSQPRDPTDDQALGSMDRRGGHVDGSQRSTDADHSPAQELKRYVVVAVKDRTSARGLRRVTGAHRQLFLAMRMRSTRA